MGAFSKNKVGKDLGGDEDVMPSMQLAALWKPYRLSCWRIKSFISVLGRIFIPTVIVMFAFQNIKVITMLIYNLRLIIYCRLYCDFMPFVMFCIRELLWFIFTDYVGFVLDFWLYLFSDSVKKGQNCIHIEKSARLCSKTKLYLTLTVRTMQACVVLDCH